MAVEVKVKGSKKMVKEVGKSLGEALPSALVMRAGLFVELGRRDCSVNLPEEDAAWLEAMERFREWLVNPPGGKYLG